MRDTDDTDDTDFGALQHGTLELLDWLATFVPVGGQEAANRRRRCRRALVGLGFSSGNLRELDETELRELLMSFWEE